MSSMFAKLAICALLVVPPLAAQTPPLVISIDDALDRALRTTSLTDHGQPFHAILAISKSDNPSSPFHGTIEVFWRDANTYRIVITSETFSQTRIVSGEKIEEHNTGDFYPVWLRTYVNALLAPVPRPDLFRHRGGRIALGEHMTSCASRDDRPGGITDQMTWGQLCFEGAEPRLSSVMDFTGFIEFKDYRKFGEKLIAYRYQDYLDGNNPVIGELQVLETLHSSDPSLFTVTQPTPASELLETTFVSTLKGESMLARADTSPWPPVHEGKTEGYMIVEAITDRTGQVREAYKHNSDNPGLEAAGVARALNYKFQPLLLNGVPQQMEMPLVLHFTSQIADPIPILTGDEISTVASGCGTPSLPSGVLTKGTVFHIKISVNEEGKVTGESFPEANKFYPETNATSVPNALLSPALRAVGQCRFTRYLRDGVPTYYHALFSFTAP
jgi:hypothetical protein